MSKARASNILVTLDDEAARRPSVIAKKIEAAGLRNMQVLGEIGIVTGEATPAVAEKIRALKGILHVEDSAEIQLPPPDAPIQ